MSRISIVFAVICWLGSSGTLSFGQIPRQSYSPPAGPTLPYQLDYFRPQLGPLDQYNQFVAPKEQLANQLGTLNQRQNYDYQALERRVAEGDQIRESQAAATGTSAGFMNLSHYYGRGGNRGSTQSRPTRQRTSLAPAMSTPGIGVSSGIGFGR